MKRHLLPAAALGAVFLALCGEWFWLQVFLGNYSYAETCLALSAAVLAIVLLAASISLAGKTATGILRIALLLTLMIVFFRVVRPYLAGSEPLSPLARLAIAAACLGGAILAAHRWSAAPWTRLHYATITFGLIFFSSFPLVGAVLATGGNPVFGLSFLGSQAGRPKNVMVLLLDELSPASSDPIVRAVRERLAYVHASAIVAAGDHTLNAVPAMLSGERFDRIMPCGPATQCAQGRALDYTQLVAREFVDIVTYVGRYCSMQRLRSCQTIVAKPVAPVVGSLACALGIPGLSVWCRNQEHAPDARVATMRREVEKAVFAAPFWQQGGVLFAHVALPHPPADSSTGSLRDEYRVNIDDSARLVGAAIARLQESFGDDFTLVVTSDHPLRVELQCGAVVYQRPDCREGLPRNDGRVPLIVGSPRPFDPPGVMTAVGLLAGVSLQPASGRPSSSR